MTVYSVIKNLLKLAARTADGVTNWQKFNEAKTAKFVVTVVSMSGTSPTLDVDIQGSLDGEEDGSENGYAVDSFSQITAPGKYPLDIANPGLYMRAKYTIGGTSPDIEFRIDADIKGQT